MINKLDAQNRFIDDGPKADRFQEFVSSPTFKDAASAAFIEFVHRQKSSGDLQSTTMLSLKLSGALEYLDVLLNIGQKFSSKTNQQKEGLDPV